MRRRVIPFVAGLALVVTACATTGRGTSTASRYTITRQQMIEVGASTVYDAVQKLQPSWLTSRGPQSMTDDTQTVPNVFMSGNQVGDVDYLQTLLPEYVDHVRWYAPGEAGARFGMGHPRGVIEVIPRGAS